MRISMTRIELTVFGLVLLALIALAIGPAWWGSAFGQAVSTSIQANATTRARRLSDGQKAKIEGIVIERDLDGIIVRETDGAQTFVVVTSRTEIKIDHKGLFRGDKPSSANQIFRGLRLTVDLFGNENGKVVARRIRFDEQDLRTAQSLERRQGLEEKIAVVPLTNVP